MTAPLAAKRGADKTPLPASVDETLALLARGDYVAERSLATALFLSLKLGRPLFLEGEAGVGKTEVAKVLARWTGGELVRLQCYEGIDAAQAVYEWDYSRQLLHLRTAEAVGRASGADAEQLEDELYSPRFLVRRPLLQAVDHGDGPAPILLRIETDAGHGGGRRKPARYSPGASAVVRMPVMNDSNGSSRSPAADRIRTLAPSAINAGGVSAAGEALQALPPNVAINRICLEPSAPAASASAR